MPDEYWSMLPVDFWLMCEGYAEKETRQYETLRNIIFGAARYNAANTAFGNNRKIANQKFDWEKPKRSDGKPEVLNYDDMKGMFEGLSEKSKN